MTIDELELESSDRGVSPTIAAVLIDALRLVVTQECLCEYQRAQPGPCRRCSILADARAAGIEL